MEASARAETNAEKAAKANRNAELEVTFEADESGTNGTHNVLPTTWGNAGEDQQRPDTANSWGRSQHQTKAWAAGELAE